MSSYSEGIFDDESSQPCSFAKSRTSLMIVQWIPVFLLMLLIDSLFRSLSKISEISMYSFLFPILPPWIEGCIFQRKTIRHFYWPGSEFLTVQVGQQICRGWVTERDGWQFDADPFRGIQYVGLDIASKGMMRLSLLICWAPKESVNTISMSRNNRILELRIHQWLKSLCVVKDHVARPFALPAIPCVKERSEPTASDIVGKAWGRMAFNARHQSVSSWVSRSCWALPWSSMCKTLFRWRTNSISSFSSYRQSHSRPFMAIWILYGNHVWMRMFIKP